MIYILVHIFILYLQYCIFCLIFGRLKTITMFELSKQAKEELLQKKKEAVSFIEHVDAILGITIETSSKVSNVKHSAPYKVNDTFQSKFISILKEYSRFLHINEIAQIAHDYEPTYTIEEAKSKMASAKNNLISKNLIIKYALDNNSNLNTFYGLKDWIQDGKPKDEHKYSEEMVSSSVGGGI